MTFGDILAGFSSIFGNILGIIGFWIVVLTIIAIGSYIVGTLIILFGAGLFEFFKFIAPFLKWLGSFT